MPITKKEENIDKKNIVLILHVSSYLIITLDIFRLVASDNDKGSNQNPSSVSREQRPSRRVTYLHDVPATHTNTAFLELVKTQPSRLGARGNKLDRKMTWKHSLTALCIQHVQHSQ